MPSARRVIARRALSDQGLGRVAVAQPPARSRCMPMDRSRSLPVELPAVFTDDSHADELAIDKVCELRIDKIAGLPRAVQAFGFMHCRALSVRGGCATGRGPRHSNRGHVG